MIGVWCAPSVVLSQVCGEAGHNAGFVGSKYMDCPNKACYLCKQMVRCPCYSCMCMQLHDYAHVLCAQ